MGTPLRVDMTSLIKDTMSMITSTTHNQGGGHVAQEIIHHNVAQDMALKGEVPIDYHEGEDPGGRGFEGLANVWSLLIEINTAHRIRPEVQEGQCETTIMIKMKCMIMRFIRMNEPKLKQRDAKSECLSKLQPNFVRLA